MKQGLNKIIQLKRNLLLKNANAAAVIIIVGNALPILIVKRMS